MDGTPAEPERDQVDPERLAELFDLVDLLTPHAIRIAVTLGVPRLIHDGVRDAETLAARTGTDADALRSLLHRLAVRGVLRDEGAGGFALTPVGELLTHTDAITALDLRGAGAQMDLAWAGLWHCVGTGEPGYPVVHGRSFWDHITSDPGLAASFDAYMEAGTAAWTPSAAAAPVWPDTGTVVAGGGGIGLLLADVLRTHPRLDGVLVELPATADRAREHLRRHGVLDRATVTTGSFFDPLPRDADVYVLGHVLHDWPDEEAAAILRRVTEAATHTTRVLIMEQVVDPAHPSPENVVGDLLMRNLFGSHERTRDQWSVLAATVGLRLCAVHPLDGYRSIIELRP